MNHYIIFTYFPKITIDFDNYTSEKCSTTEKYTVFFPENIQVTYI